MQNKDIIREFYEALNNLDPDKMASLYHPEVTFEDPAFGVLHRDDARNMWRMLCSTQDKETFHARCENIVTDGDKVSSTLVAEYLFGKQKRRVINTVYSSFQFRDGLIIDHRDHFNLYRWSRQAFGLLGLLIGWTPFFRKKIKKTTNSVLKRYSEKVL